MTRSALLIIDVQNAFTRRPHTRDLPRKIAQHLQRHARDYDWVAFTKFVNTPSSPLRRTLDYFGTARAPDTLLAPPLAPFANPANTFSKGTSSALGSRRLLAALRKRKIRDVYLCGTDTDACVLATAFDATDHGFRVFLIEELCASHAHHHLHAAALEIIRANAHAPDPKKGAKKKG